MRKLLTLFACLYALSTQAQVPGSNYVIDTSYRGITYDSLLHTYYEDTIKMKLIDLALKNPAVDISRSNIKTSELELKHAKSDWLNTVAISGNLNELVINNRTINGINAANLYPKYNFGIRLPLGIFSNQQKNIAAEKMEQNKTTDHLLKRQLVKDVLYKYEAFKEKKEQVELYRQITDGQKTTYENKQTAFQDGTTKDISEVNKEYVLWVEYRGKLRERESAYMLAIYDLEEIIGVPLSTVINTSTVVSP